MKISQPSRWPGILGAFILIVFVIHYPAEAAGLARGIAGFVEQAAHGIGTAFTDLHLGHSR